MGLDAAHGLWRRDAPAILFALLFPSLATWLYFVAFAGDSDEMRWAYGIGKAAQFSLPVFWVYVVQGERPRLRELFAWHGVGLGLAFGLLVVAVMMPMFHESPLAAEASLLIWAKISVFGITTRRAYLAMAVFYAGIHSLLEEYYWRWFVFGQLRGGLPWVLAAAISSVGFAAHHIILLVVYLPKSNIGTTLFFAFCVGIGGAVWAWLYHRTGSLLGSWLSHLLVDAGLMGLGFIWCRGYLA
jgi:membrane protease YdiL (CAAX protease family)